MLSPKEVLFNIVGRYRDSEESIEDYTKTAIIKLQKNIGFVKCNLILLRTMKEVILESQTNSEVTDRTKINVAKQFSKENKELYLSNVSNFKNSNLWIRAITRAYNWGKL